MAKVTTQLDIELAQWNHKIQQMRKDMQETAQAAKKANVGESLIGKINSYGGAIGVGAIAAGIKATLSQFDSLNDAATKLGETPEVIQRVQRAAELSGTSLDGVAGGFIKLEKALGDVENSKAADILDKYGLSAETLMAMPLDEKVTALADAFKQARDDGTGVYDLQALLGKSAAELIPLMEEGGDAIREMYEGTAVVANEAVYQMALMNDEIDNVIGNLKNLAGSALVETYDALLKMGAMVAEVFGDEGAMDKVQAHIEGRQLKAQAKAEQLTQRRETRAENIGKNVEEERARKAAEEQEKLDKKAADEQEKEDKRRADNIAKLQAEIEQKRIDMLPDDQQLAEYKAKLAALLEDVSFVDPTMSGLQDAIDYATDPADQEALLQKQKDAMEMQSQIESLNEKANKTKSETIKTAATPGSVTAAINTIFGRSANELILDETKTQTKVLERIDKSLQKMADGSGGTGDLFDQFAFP